MTTDALFDPLAPTYDDDFTRSPIARHLRARVHARLGALIQPGQHALELGCGTGEDALHLAQRGVHITATDASDAMLAIARQKLAPFPHANTASLDLQGLSAECKVQSAKYNVVFANFGVLNCLSDWRPLAAWLAERIVSGGHVAFGVMSPFCVWETLWHGVHGDWRTATRRWRRKGTAFSIPSSQFSVLSSECNQVTGVRYQPEDNTKHKVQNLASRTLNYELRTLNPELRTENSSLVTRNSSLIFYPSVRRLTRDFAPWFRRVHIEPLGVFLPPSDVYGVIEKRPRLLRTLTKLDDQTKRMSLLANLADHYWIELQRAPDSQR
jgi:SAM-dependent methyltransferase